MTGQFPSYPGSPELRQDAATEREFLEDNIATVAYHLGKPGARLGVSCDHDTARLAVDPGEVLAEISRRLSVPVQGSGDCDQIALDAAHQIECLPSAAEGQEARKTALIHLIVLDAIRCASADDLQLWIRHGRVGIGQSYRQEVERARKIETERSALPSPESK